MFVGAYWSERKESKESAAARVTTFLLFLCRQNIGLSTWYRKGNSLAEALTSSLTLDESTIFNELKENRRDDSHRPIPELGFQFSAWNGGKVAFSARVGVHSRFVSNSAVLNFGDAGTLGNDQYRSVLQEMVRVFDPDHAAVTSRDRMVKARSSKPWEAGLLTYQRGGAIVEHELD